MRTLLKQLFQIFLPDRCFLCHALINTNEAFCQDCDEILPHYCEGCKQCAVILEQKDDFSLCAQCLLKPPAFDHVIALFEYKPPISSLIWRLKFSNDLSVAKIFSQLWIHALNKKNQQSLPELIIPVPLHPVRLKERGFNQTLEIAKPIGKYFQIPIDTHTCIRIKNTLAQSSLPARKRKNNVNHAFGLSYALNVKHIAILDDVMTTGNTVSEISALLKNAGIETVEVWCCARATF